TEPTFRSASETGSAYGFSSRWAKRITSSRLRNHEYWRRQQARRRREHSGIRRQPRQSGNDHRQRQHARNVRQRRWLRYRRRNRLRLALEIRLILARASHVLVDPAPEHLALRAGIARR